MGSNLADATPSEVRKQIFFQIALLADGVVAAPARMVLLVPLQRRLAKGVAGAHGGLELDNLPCLDGVYPCSFLRLGSIARLTCCCQPDAGIDAQGKLLLDTLDPEFPEPSARARSRNF